MTVGYASALCSHQYYTAPSKLTDGQLQLPLIVQLQDLRLVSPKVPYPILQKRLPALPIALQYVASTTAAPLLLTELDTGKLKVRFLLLYMAKGWQWLHLAQAPCCDQAPERVLTTGQLDLSCDAAMRTYVDVISLMSAGSPPYSPCGTCTVCQGNIHASSAPHNTCVTAAIG